MHAPATLRLAALAALLAGTLPAQAQGWQWARSAGGSAEDAAPGDVARGVAVDAAGNAYVAGYFYGTATFGPFSLTSAGENDAFLAKYSPTGNVLWVRRGGGSEGDFASRVVVDASGNVYVAGYFQGTANYGGVTLTSTGSWDTALVKYSPAGDVIWARSAGGTATDVSYHVAVDAAGDVYITGRFGHPDGAPITFGSFTLTSAGTADFFLAKYTPDGDVLWARGGGGAGGDRGYGLTVDAAGDVYAAGRFEQTATFGGVTLASAGGFDVFLVKYSTVGELQWAQRAGGPGNDAVRELAAEPSGDVYAVGHFVATATFGDTTLTSAGPGDAFLARYAPGGGLRWVRSAGGPGNDVHFGLTLDVDGNPFVTGKFQGTAVFGTYPLTSAGSDDVHLAAYTPDGDVLWAQGGGGTMLDRGHGVAVDAAGGTYVVGHFRDAASFGPHALTSAGGNDIFVARAYARAPVEVIATPLDPPITIPPEGGPFRFTATVTNTSSQPQTVDAWTALTGPRSREPVISPRTFTLPPGASRTWTVSQRVPGVAPPGTYTYHVRVGTFPSTALSSDSFTFVKGAGALAASENGGVEHWPVSGWEETEVEAVEARATERLPGGYALSGARPNPFTSTARLDLELAATQAVTGEVLDALGRRVALLHEGPLAAGAHALVVEAGALPSGLYVVRVTGEAFSVARRVALVR